MYPVGSYDYAVRLMGSRLQLVLVSPPVRYCESGKANHKQFTSTLVIITRISEYLIM